MQQSLSRTKEILARDCFDGTGTQSSREVHGKCGGSSALLPLAGFPLPSSSRKIPDSLPSPTSRKIPEESRILGLMLNKGEDYALIASASVFLSPQSFRQPLYGHQKIPECSRIFDTTYSKPTVITQVRTQLVPWICSLISHNSEI